MHGFLTDQSLPTREAGLFKKVIKCYEQKQYKAGLKHAKQILQNSKCENHGETLSMKGLLQNLIGKNSESLNNVKRGLRSNVKSHVCWHVYGLVYRAEKDYSTAIKAYLNALKLDRENLTILRDLAILQIHTKDFEGFKESRARILKLKGGIKMSWTGYALSCHLLNDLITTRKVLQICRSHDVESTNYSNKMFFEQSEIRMYELEILGHLGESLEGIRFIYNQEQIMLDKQYVWFTLGNFLIQKSNFKLASKIFEHLFFLNQENVDYIQKVLECQNLKSTQEKANFLRLYVQKYPKSNSIISLFLSLLPFCEEFELFINNFMKSSISKGVLPLWSIIKCSISSCKKKLDFLASILNDFLINIKYFKYFSEADLELEPPSTYIFLIFIFAQLKDFQGQHIHAIDIINEAISHTPTCVELYMIKARILKHAGNIFEASKVIDYGRSLDTADRYIANKCSKYLLRCGKVNEAILCMSDFIKEGKSTLDYLNDYQTLWFQYELAKSYFDRMNFKYSLKYSLQLLKHFADFIDDKLDFHAYCIRKCTLRSYIELLGMENDFKLANVYFKISSLAIQVYIQLYDNCIISNKNIEFDYDNHNLDRQTKGITFQNVIYGEDSINYNCYFQNESSNSEINDINLDDSSFFKCTNNHLEECLKILVSFSTNSIIAHLFAYQIYSRMNKPLLMARSIRRSLFLDKYNPNLYSYIIDFSLRFNTNTNNPSNINENIYVILKSECNEFLENQSPFLFARRCLENHNESLENVFVSFESLYRMQPSTSVEILEYIDSIHCISLINNLKFCIDTKRFLEVINSFGECSTYKERFLSKCRSVFPLSPVFINS